MPTMTYAKAAIVGILMGDSVAFRGRRVGGGHEGDLRRRLLLCVEETFDKVDGVVASCSPATFRL
jgi:hypothetical protein